jgi:hypothetical protein
LFAGALALVACLAVSTTAVAAAGAGPAQPAAKAAKAKKLKVRSTGQKKILRKRAITVKVSAKRTGKLKLRTKSTTFDSRDPIKLAKPKTLRLKADAKAKTAKLRLTAKGRNRIKSCEARKITVSAKSAKGAKAKFKLRRNTKRCAPRPIDLSRADQCDLIGVDDGVSQADRLCLLPFPDDFHTVKDKSTDTGRRVAFDDGAMPRNASGQPISAAAYNLNDGFSPGQAITLKVPGLDTPEALAQTKPVGLSDLGRYTKKNSPVVVVDMTTNKRWPIWVEIDSNSSTPERTALLIHPAKNFDSGHRYAVALRKLRDGAGNRLEAPEGFRYYRDDLPSGEAPINDQRKRFDQVFRALRKDKVKRRSLYLAWDFTVSSDQNIAGRMLHIRDDAFAQLGDTNLADRTVQGTAPAFTVDSVVTDPEPEIARRVTGTFTVPCYLTNNCEPPATFTLDSSGKPIQQGTYEANFDCIVPHAAVDDPGATPGRASLYGHGLLGSASEVGSSPQRSLAQTHGFVFCATDTIGFSEGDIPNTIGILQNLGRFPQLVDRSQQGFLNGLLLGRLMISPDGLVSDPAFQQGGAPVIDTSRLYYNGNSQGSTLGGGLTAVAPDFTRASLGVPAMNYSVLLNRSIDFDIYKAILDPAYPDPLTQELALSLIQMLWDRSETNGYAHRMTDDPLANTPPHEVLLNVAFGDHQVTTWQADVEARTIGAEIHSPVVYEGRWPGVDVAWDIPRIGAYPFAGSAIVYWDSGPVRPDPASPGDLLGTDPPPLTNTPNTSGEDPHGLPRQAAAEQQMVSEFLRPNAQSSISDTCLGAPCFAGGFTGP